jgi:hypothetical protein
VGAVRPLTPRNKFMLTLSVWVAVLACIYFFITSNAAKRPVPDRTIY